MSEVKELEFGSSEKDGLYLKVNVVGFTGGNGCGPGPWDESLGWRYTTVGACCGPVKPLGGL